MFIFNSDFYEQIDGVATSSVLGSVFAKIFVFEVETKLLKSDKYHNFFNSLYYWY